MRTRIRIRRLSAVLALGTLVAASSGCDDDGPTAPPRQAALGSRGSLDFSCGLNCSYEGEAFNGGTGCAIRARGVTRLLAADGSELANDDWALEPARRIGPGEAFLYDGCCFSLTDVNSMGSFRTEIFWDETSCN